MNYEIKGYYKIKNELWMKDEEKFEDQFRIYLWPSENNPDRQIQIFPNDILTIESEDEGICYVMKHTGSGCINILIPKKDLQEYRDTIQLGFK